MYRPIEELSKNSKVLIYQAKKRLSTEEIRTISEEIAHFIQTWESHGHPILASTKIFLDHFIIIAIDESYSSSSGCSLDKSTQLIRTLEEKYQLGLLDRGKIAYQNNESIKIVDFTEIAMAVHSGEIMPDSLIFNNTVPTLHDLENNWKIPAKSSWLSKYFNN